MIPEKKNDCSSTCCLPLQQTTGKVAGFLSRSLTCKRTQPVTLTGMSLLLDVNPELVNESLNSLRELGAIKLEHRRVIIRDKELLQNIAVYD